ncbi:MAG: VanZ family protein [Dysgonamonadaceae bacterium]|nr:VanZ family protein [Dysgonamonadaceae bacterium]
MILLIITILTICFILGQSMMPVSHSDSESKAVTESIVKPIEEAITGNRTIEHSIVRKWAHCIEYAILGIELSILMIGQQKLWLSLIRVFSYGTGISLIDETIQIFSRRGPEVRDVWIDATGIAIGIVVTTLICVIIRKLKLKTAIL